MSESITLNVAGMKCGGCETNVKGKLENLDGVLSIDASSKDDQVTVEFDNAKVNLNAIKDAINSAGFNVE